MATPGADLIRRLAAGDRAAFAPFYDRYASLVYPLVLRIVRDRADAADVLQEVFWEAWQTAGSYDPGRGTPESWLLVRAHSRALDRVRSPDDEALAATHEEFDTLAAIHAVGALDGDDLARFEAHLAAGCAACGAALREHEQTLGRVAAVEQRLTPPAPVRDALLARLDATAPRERPAARRWLPRAAAIAAGMLITAALGAGFMAAHYEARLGAMARETALVRERLALQEEQMRAQVRAYAAVVELLRDPATHVVAMRGTGSNPEALGRVVWHETAGGHVFVANLPAPPAGKTYELWTIAGGTPRPAGTFGTDPSGKAAHAIAPAGKVDVFAVTLEPAGGVPAPTGPIVLASARP